MQYPKFNNLEAEEIVIPKEVNLSATKSQKDLIPDSHDKAIAISLEYLIKGWQTYL